MTLLHSPAVFCVSCCTSSDYGPATVSVCGLSSPSGPVCVYCGLPAHEMSSLVPRLRHSLSIWLGRLHWAWVSWRAGV